MLRPVFVGFLMLAGTPAAWAQGPVTADEIARLEATADTIGQQAAGLRRSNPALATAVDKTLADLRDEVSFLKVKLRRGAPVTRAEFNDVRDRLEALRLQSFPPRAPAAAADQPKAPAQPSGANLLEWSDKLFVNVSAVGQFGRQTITSTFSFALYDEIGSATASRRVQGGVFMDITGGVHLAGPWGVAFNFYSRSAPSDGTVTASVPDPVLYNHARSVSGTIPNMAHSEMWFAPLLVYTIPVSDKIDLMLMAGPAVTRLRHELASSVTVTEPASGPKVEVGLTTISHNYWNYEVGADLRYLLTKQIGVGGFIRFGHDRANVSKTNKVTLGGPQLGLGARIRF